MSDDDNKNKNVTFTEDQITAVTKIVADALKPVTTELTSFKDTLGEINLKLADTGKSDDDADAANAGADKASATTPDSTAPKPFTTDDARKMMDEREQTAAQAQAQAQANQEWLAKNAPKVAGNSLLQNLLKNCKDDDERKTSLAQWTESVKASGADLPDLTTPSSEGEGGQKANSADNLESKEQKQIELAQKSPAFKL